MSDHGSRGPLHLLSRGLNLQMSPGHRTTSRGHKEEAAIFVAALDIGPAPARKRHSPQGSPQPERRARITSKEEGALQWQQDEALHHRPAEEAEAVSHQQEDVGQAMEEWPAYTL